MNTPLSSRENADDGYTMHIDYGQIWITAPDGSEVARWVIRDHDRPSAHELARERFDLLNDRDGHA